MLLVNCCLECTSLLGLDLHFDGNWYTWRTVLLSTSPSELALSGMKRTYTTFKSGTTRFRRDSFQFLEGNASHRRF